MTAIIIILTALVSAGPAWFLLAQQIDRNHVLEETIDAMRRREGVPVPKPVYPARTSSPKLPAYPNAV